MDKYYSYILYDDPVPFVASSIKGIHDEMAKNIAILDESLSDDKRKEWQELNKAYKQTEILIYPIKMDKYLECTYYTQILKICKNDTPDPKVISMSFLDFLFYQDKLDKKQLYLYRLIKLLQIALHINIKDLKFFRDKKGRISLQINNIVYNYKDFDEIREIICMQNNIELTDESVHPDIRKAMEEARAFVNKHNGNKKPGTLDDQIDCVMTAMHIIDRQEIKEMTIRSFNRILERYIYKLEYQITKTGMMSGLVKFDKPMQSWTSNFEKTFKEKYEDLMIDAEAFKDKYNVDGVQENNNEKGKDQ